MNKASSIVDAIKELARRENSVFVAIDGNGGAGKTTLSKHLKLAIPGLRTIGMDYYYDPILKRSDFLRVKEELIMPLKNNKTAKSKVYDWPNEKFIEGASVEPGGIIVFEGWYAMEKNLVDLYDYRIWIDCPPEVGMQRGLKRDNGAYRSHWENIWLPEMKIYSETQKPFEKADMVISYLDVPLKTIN